MPKNNESSLDAHEVEASIGAPSVPEKVETSERAANPTTGSQALANWPEEILRAIEKQLAVFVGPLAKVIVKKAAARTKDTVEFYRLLAAGIEGENERDAFLAAMLNRGPGAKSDTGSPTTRTEVRTGSQTSDAGETLTPAVVERATRLLAKYVGPLSGVLTKKAAQRADNVRALYLLLAKHVGTDSERDRFLQEAGISKMGS